MISHFLENYGIFNSINKWQLSPKELQDIIINNNMGIKLSKFGSLMIKTGKFTGRSPKDRFFVKDSITKNKIWWDGEFNQSFSPEKFDVLYGKIVKYLSNKTLYIRDSYLCSDKRFKINIRSISEFPWSDLFIYNLFLRCKKNSFSKKYWLLFCVPKFYANPEKDGTNNKNFSIINFKKKVIIIGGSGYTGEIKKSLFSVLNFLLPYKNVFPMHCSANVGKNNKDTAIFFGLSGTGKTTISNDKDRKLIGDDEHGWTEDNLIFNFEGGCYAKVLGISKNKEPMIYKSIKKGSMLENVVINKDGNVNFFDDSITKNTRVSYPIFFIKNIEKKLLSSNIKNIFFLTYDVFGVIPPISKLNKAQSSYYFLLGYTSKVAGTEYSEKKNYPKATFSSCFGEPFMPLHPIIYTKMLIEKLNNNSDINVWLINTGFIGEINHNVYDEKFKRISINDTRTIIKNVLNKNLLKVSYNKYPIFNFYIPEYCPEISSSTILNPKNLWNNEKTYSIQINNLVKKMVNRFNILNKNKIIDKFILSGGPVQI